MDELLLSAGTLGAIMALFVTLAYVVHREQIAGKRFIFEWFRNGLDQGIALLSSWLQSGFGLLRQQQEHRRARVTDPVVAQAVFRNATRTPLTVTHTDNHLSKMREHKIETALTAAQKKKRRKQKLEERF